MVLWNKLITSRKAVFTVVLLTFGSVAMWFGKLDATNWLELVKWVLCSYLGVQGTIDAVEKFKNAK